MNAQSRKVASAAAITAVLIGALAYALYRNRASAEGSQKGSAGSAAPSSRSGAAEAKSPPSQPRVPMTLPPEPSIPPAERAKAFELLDALKQQANLAFQEGRYEDAVKRYQECLEVTSVLGGHDAEAVRVDQVVRANVIMTFIRLHDYDSARLVATMLLQDAAIALPDDLKVKVLYRRGLASKSLGDREAALADLRAALHFSPNQQNPAVTKEIEQMEKGP